MERGEDNGRKGYKNCLGRERKVGLERAKQNDIWIEKKRKIGNNGL
jgi:hypothetical protein